MNLVGAVTQRSLDRVKLFARIDAAQFSEMQAKVLLQRGHTCHAECPAIPTIYAPSPKPSATTATHPHHEGAIVAIWVNQRGSREP
jgi:hypothetical protein